MHTFNPPWNPRRSLETALSKEAWSNLFIRRVVLTERCKAHGFELEKFEVIREDEQFVYVRVTGR